VSVHFDESDCDESDGESDEAGLPRKAAEEEEPDEGEAEKEDDEEEISSASGSGFFELGNVF